MSPGSALVRRSPGRIVVVVAVTSGGGPYERVSPVIDHPLRVTHRGGEVRDRKRKDLRRTSCSCGDADGCARP
jgi:hypothetical protein